MPKNATPRRIDLRSSATGGLVISGGGGGSAPATAVDFTDLTGTATTAQVPWAALETVSLEAGNGLTGGGDLQANRTFAVGAGDGITVSADAVALASSVAGAGLTFTTGVLAVGAGDGLTVNDNDVALTTPGTLTAGTSNSASSNHTHAITALADVSGGDSALLKSASGALELLSLTTATIAADTTLTLTPGTYAILSDGKKLRTSTYTSGFAGAGFQLDQGATFTGQTFLELDNLSVRGVMNVYELLIHQIRATNGSIIVANTGKVSTRSLYSGSEGVAGSQYTINTDPEHGFEVNDLVRAQRFTGSGTYQSNMRVVGVYTTTNCRMELVSGAAPQVGYEYVRIGNTTDADRQGGIYLTADDTGAPFLDVWNGVDAHSDWNTAGVIKLRLGLLDGITSGTNEYGLWAAGANSGDHLLISPTSGFELVAGNGLINIDDLNGISVTAQNAATYDNAHSFRFVRSGQTIGGLYSYYQAGYDAIRITALAGVGKDAYIISQAVSDTAASNLLEAYYSDTDVSTSIQLDSDASTSNIELRGDTIEIAGRAGATVISLTGALSATGTISAVDGLVTLSPYSPHGGVGMKAASGTWARGFHATSSTSTRLGGWGFYGTDDTLSYLYGGVAYNDNTLRVYPATDRVGIGADVNPSYTLDVTGTFRVTSTSIMTGVTFNAANTYAVNLTDICDGTHQFRGSGASWRFGDDDGDVASIGYRSTGNCLTSNIAIKMLNYGVDVTGTHQLSSAEGAYMYVKGSRLCIAYRNSSGTYSFFTLELNDSRNNVAPDWKVWTGQP